jgi:hypothetical protein
MQTTTGRAYGDGTEVDHSPRSDGRFDQKQVEIGGQRLGVELAHL